MRRPVLLLLPLLAGCTLPYAVVPATGSLTPADGTAAEAVTGTVALHLGGSGNIRLTGDRGTACEANYSPREGAPGEGFMWCAPGYAGQVYVERPEDGIVEDGRRWRAGGSAWLVGQPDTPVAGQSLRLRFVHE